MLLSPRTGLVAGSLGLAWLAGLALHLCMPQLWPLSAVLGLLAAALATCALAWRWPALRWAVAVSVVASLAFAYANGRAAWRMAEALPPALEGQDLQLTGLVAELPVVGELGLRFVFEVEEARTTGGEPVAVPTRVLLNWHAGYDGEALVAAAPRELRAGQRWRLNARLRAPHGLMNPHGFDSELWFFERNLRAAGSVRATAAYVPQRLADNAGAPVQRWRQRIRDAIERTVSDAAMAGLLAALAVGDQAAIERADWDLFRATGVAHLMSISGLHVTMFAWLAAGVVGWLWRRSAWLINWVPAPQAARLGGVLLAAAYALLAGWGVPAQRTVWMLATVALLRHFGLQWPAAMVLLTAALVVTLADPWALALPGFWLSFLAVGLLMHATLETAAPPPGSWRQRAHAQLRAGLRTQVVATLGLAPLSLVFFNQVSVVGFVANLVAIPVVTLLITPLALAGMVLPPLWLLAAGLGRALHSLLTHLGSAPWAVWTVAAAPAWGVAAGLFGGLLLMLPLPWHLRLCGAAMLPALLWPAVPRPAEGDMEVLAVDIGQGNAVLVRTARHLLVYDTGPRLGTVVDAGSRVLLPLLQARGERQVNLLMLSHRDTDHVGGAAALLRHAGVQALSSSLEPGHELRQGPQPHGRCEAGQRWAWDKVQFEVLHPRPEDYATATKPNGLSCVLRVQPQRGPSLLLAGDIEAAQELALVQREGVRLPSQVLLVPHHGSRTSSTPEFLAAVRPEVAVVQAAYRSRFGHPHAQVVQRYEQAGINLQRSDACGAWRQMGTEPATCQREAARRYWHHRP